MANWRGPPDAHDDHAFNQRSVAGILNMIRTVGAMVEAHERAEQLVATLEAGLVRNAPNSGDQRIIPLLEACLTSDPWGRQRKAPCFSGGLGAAGT